VKDITHVIYHCGPLVFYIILGYFATTAVYVCL